VAYQDLPAIDRLRDYRPALALVGPGLGADVVPFSVPAGFGVSIVAPTGPPLPFDEMFTGTPDGSPDAHGKRFVTIGKLEAFGLTDLLTYHDTLVGVRAFHEVSGVSLPPLPALLDFISVVLRCFNPGYPRSTPGMWPSAPRS